MSDEVERIHRLLDDMAAERRSEIRPALTPDESALAETAAFLKTTHDGGMPDPQFVDRLGARLASLRAPASADPAPPAVASTPAPTPAAGLSRRGLLGRLGAAAVGLAAGAGAGEAARGRQDSAAAAAAYDRGAREGYRRAVDGQYNVPMVPPDRGEWLGTGIARTAVSPGHAVRFRAGAIEGFLVDPGGGEPIFAVSASCTHMGCLLNWLDAAGTFLCPCHGAQYQADGTVLSGIARHPLPRLQVRVSSAGLVEVWAVGAHAADTSVLPYREP